MNLNHKILVRTWSFSDSLFYSVTILTTVGYNSHTPNTSVGKIATMIYATFGIPLMLLCICNVGFMLSDLLQYGQLHKTSSYKKSTEPLGKVIFDNPRILKRDTIVSVINNTRGNNCTSDIQHVVLNKSHCPEDSIVPDDASTRYGTIKLQNRCSLCEECDDFDVDCEWCKQDINFKIRNCCSRATQNDQANTLQAHSRQSSKHPVTYAVVLLIVYICLGAVIFSAWKNQPFTDGAYFCFLTLTTIGSCDMLKNAFNPSNETVELLFYCTYLIAGLMLTSAAVLLMRKNVVKFEFLSTISKFQKKNDEVAL